MFLLIFGAIFALSSSYILYKSDMPLKTYVLTFYDITKYKLRKIFGNSNNVIFNDNNAEVEYEYNSRKFVVCFPRHRGPTNIFKVEHDNRDITTFMRERLGVDGNFHGILTTPKMLGLNGKIQITYFDGKTKNYEKDEVIFF